MKTTEPITLTAEERRQAVDVLSRAINQAVYSVTDNAFALKAEEKRRGDPKWSSTGLMAARDLYAESKKLLADLRQLSATISANTTKGNDVA